MSTKKRKKRIEIESTKTAQKPMTSHNENYASQHSLTVAVEMPDGKMAAFRGGYSFRFDVWLQDSHVNFLRKHYDSFDKDFGIILASLTIAQVNLLRLKTIETPSISQGAAAEESGQA